MSARINRSRAAMAVAVFAVIAVAWASVQAGADVPPVCPPTTADCAPINNLQQNAEITADMAPGIAEGTALGEVADSQKQANSEVASAQSGVGPAGSPGVVGVAPATGAGVYEDAAGQPFVDSTACNPGTVQPDPILPPPPARSGIPGASTVSAACHDNNKYYCWDRVLDLDRHYTPGSGGVYWAWQTHLSWCGYTMGRITSHSYNDHDAISVGLNCALTNEQRVPVEKISSDHWQEHSNFTFRCAAGAINHEDHATEGWHFWSNGYYKEIQRGG